MKKNWNLLPIFIIILFLVWLVNLPDPSVKISKKEITRPDSPRKSALRQELEFAAGTNLLSNYHLASSNKKLAKYTHHSLGDSLLTMLNPESLKKYEGSYTTDDLKNGDDSSSEIKLKSSWITGSSIPAIALLVGQNPASGKYEINGGEVYLPSRGIGLSFEEDQNTGESQTFLNMKRTF